MDREDGEMSDDSTMLVDDDAGETALETNTTMLYKTEKHGIVIKSLEKVDASKLEERAKRFGLCLTGNKAITQKQIDELYENFGIKNGNERHFRFDSIHLSGVGGLTTKEIFQYLDDYKPLSLEWIDRTCCNVVCQDHISAALALLIHSREIEDKNLKIMLAEKSDHHWREGVSNKENLILMRFATNGDKKIVRKKSENNDFEYLDDNMESVVKNPWGDLCKSWGVYDHQEVFHRKTMNHDDIDDDENNQLPQSYAPIKNKKLAMRLGKRTLDIHNSDNSEDSSSDTEWKIKSKTPRMRMHADDEEKKQKKKYISNVPKEECREQYAPLSIEIVNSSSNYKQRESTKLSDKFKYHNTKEQKYGIQSRLGDKVDFTVDNESSEESASSKHSDCNIMSKVQKIKKSKASNNIWSRLEVKQTNKNVRSDLRHIIKSKKQKRPNNIRDRLGNDDLRERLGKTKHSNLRIEIDNSR